MAMGKEKLTRDNAKERMYQSGMAGPNVARGQEVVPVVRATTRRRNMKDVVCPSCGLNGHAKRTSEQCLLSTTNSESEYYAPHAKPKIRETKRSPGKWCDGSRDTNFMSQLSILYAKKAL